jgi:hypothetical protein
MPAIPIPAPITSIPEIPFSPQHKLLIHSPAGRILDRAGRIAVDIVCRKSALFTVKRGTVNATNTLSREFARAVSARISHKVSTAATYLSIYGSRFSLGTTLEKLYNENRAII